MELLLPLTNVDAPNSGQGVGGFKTLSTYEVCRFADRKTVRATR